MILASQPSAPETRASDYHRLIRPVDGLLKQLRRFLVAQLDDFEPEARELAAYCLRHEGKRLRPLLVFFCRCQEKVSPTLAGDLVRAAAVVELVHQATLVHDDILDDAEMRHSSQTPWARWGRSAAVLIGDALFAQALHLASQFDTGEVCREVAAATRQVCSGEIAQTFRRGQPSQDLEHYLRVIDLKTAELFRVSGYLGARLTGADVTLANQTAQACRHLGIAYQMFDDLADYAADEQRAGKTLGTDMASGKMTLPILYLQDALGPEVARDWRQEWLDGRVDSEQLQQQLRDTGALERSFARCRSEVEAAEAAIQAASNVQPTLVRLRDLSAYVGTQINRLQPSAQVA
ncbi:MAG: polyprenyl synthetase family protein [Opitutales bacterium]